MQKTPKMQPRKVAPAQASSQTLKPKIGDGVPVITYGEKLYEYLMQNGQYRRLPYAAIQEEVALGDPVSVALPAGQTGTFYAEAPLPAFDQTTNLTVAREIVEIMLASAAPEERVSMVKGKPKAEKPKAAPKMEVALEPSTIDVNQYVDLVSEQPLPKLHKDTLYDPLSFNEPIPLDLTILQVNGSLVEVAFFLDNTEGEGEYDATVQLWAKQIAHKWNAAPLS